MNSREFVCDDCKANVFEFGDGGTDTLCAGCRTIREYRAQGKLTPKQEAELREILHCQIPREEGVTDDV